MSMPLKASAERSGRLYPHLWLLWIFLAFWSCNNDYEEFEEKNIQAESIVFTKTATFYGSPVLEMDFNQDFILNEAGVLDSSTFYVEVHNLGSSEIDSLAFEVIVFDTSGRSAKDFLLKAKKSLVSLSSEPVSKTFAFNYFDTRLEASRVEVRLLSFPNGYARGGAYEGFFTAYKMDSLPANNPSYLGRSLKFQGPVTASVTADGQVSVWVLGDKPFDRLMGDLSPSDIFIGLALDPDGSPTFSLQSCDTCQYSPSGNGWQLGFAVSDSSEAQGISLIELHLFPSSN